jgi:predicted ATPase/class 3 adenylate cyclase
MGGVPSGTVTFLFTDIEGSTPLWDHHPESMRIALEAHDVIVRGAVDAHGGCVFATGGDGFGVAFQRAGDALRAALAVQVAVHEHDWPAAADLKVRIALHTGEAVERDGDYFGAAVNRAARLAGLARGGQVLVSATTASLIPELLEPDVTLVDLGMHSLRGLDRDERVFQLNQPGITQDFEPFTRVLVGNLPTPATSFVGQSAEVKRLAGDLARRRLITLTGVGGVGKTRLALEASWAAQDEFSGGVWLVELAPIAEDDAVVNAVAAALRVDPRPGISLDTAIIEALVGRSVLLIVDNCEHVIDAASRLIGRIVSSCPTVRVLATSREPLGVAGERLLGVRSLDPHLEAVELFCDRAEESDDRFSPSAGDREVIGRICARLDGIPLAIELAAARTRTMSVHELEQRLTDRFRLLRASGRGRVERHQTLRATVAWSYQLLDEDERVVFDRCSVFAGTFDVRAAQAVCADDSAEFNAVEDALGSLVDKNMVVVDDHRGADTRFKLLETLRQYAEERLSDETEACRTRHLFHYLAVAQELDDLLQGSDLGGGIGGFRLELDNIRAATQRAIATRDPALVSLVRSTKTFAQVGSVPEIGRWFDQILDALDDPPSYVYGAAAMMALAFGAEDQRSVELARAGIDRTSPDDPETADCCWVLGLDALRPGRNEPPVTFEGVERAAPLYLAAGNTVHAVMIMCSLACLEDGVGAQKWADQARRLAAGLTSELADICATLAEGAAAWKAGASAVTTLRGVYERVVAADVRGNVSAWALMMLGPALAREPAAYSDADAFLATSLRRFQSDGYRRGTRHALWASAVYLTATARPEAAGLILSHLDVAGPFFVHAESQRRALETIQALPQHAEWRARGLMLSRDEAIDIAVAALEQTR